MMQELINQKNEIINSLVEWVKKENPGRTLQHNKCYRDLEMIFDALVCDLKNNSDVETQYVANKFWSRGVPMLRDYTVELQVYNMLLLKIQQLLTSLSQLECYNTQLERIFDNIKNTVINGPKYKINTWDYICNKRIATFNWTDRIPDINSIKKVVNSIHEFTPSKQRRVRYNIDVIPNYQNDKLKNTIYAGTYADNPKLPTSRYNPQVLAPWILSFSFRPEGNTENRNTQYYEKEAWLDIGIAVQHASLASAALGLDVGFCLCIQNKDEMALLLNGRSPVMYLCLGYRNDSVEYYCPIKKTTMPIPGRDHDTKPTISEYVFYKQS